MSGEITGQGHRITQPETTTGVQNRCLEGAGVAIACLIGRVRELRGYIRAVGMEPPTAEPTPEKAREFIHRDV
ncbi:hypothetical protein ACFVX6_05290 [Streptomyces sp. NPDC058289]|uniref:hypothetical protein n=1 Tax=Streptomyces sp. NPDC058289 TaxID=3346425 RepID=UPI0036E43DC3